MFVLDKSQLSDNLHVVSLLLHGVEETSLNMVMMLLLNVLFVAKTRRQ